jgi:glutamyl-Q tRNA(Asp) synthetase
MSDTVVTRFAPSPTGLLHIGHAWSAMFAFESAMRAAGRFLLRIEDIDFTRCRPEFESALYEDLHWLGLHWETPVLRQSEHLADYAAAAEQLKNQGLLYPCFCTRKEIQREIEAAGGAPHGPDGPVYPGTCRDLSPSDRKARMQNVETFAWRLDLQKSLDQIGHSLRWFDHGKGWQTAAPELFGDVVLVRKDIGCSYHLAVVHDDALQRVTRVTRGLDLFEATHIQRVLQELLGLPVPEYHHHALVCDVHGRRMAKRDESESIRSLRERGIKPSEIRSKLELLLSESTLIWT